MNIEQATLTLNAYMRQRRDTGIDVRAQLVVTLLYLLAVLSVPMLKPAILIWMLSYPIVMSEALGVGYGRIFVRSLWVLPLILLIGVFSPVLDHEPMWVIGDIVISRGWVMLISVIMRGLLAVQALLLLVSTSGFIGLCRGLSGLGVPDVLVSQLLMLYRYLIVLLDEAFSMHRARQSRGFGRKNYPLAMWGTFVGQLLMRSIRRSQRVSDAMRARGFEGNVLPGKSLGSMRLSDWAYMAAWIVAIAIFRFMDLTALVDKII